MRAKGSRCLILLGMICCAVIVPPARSAEIIVDNGGAGTSSTGSWFTVSSSDAYGGNWAGNNTGSSTYTFTTNVSGSCEVFAQWSAGTNRCTAVPVQIYDDTAPLGTVTVNQQTNHFQWTQLGASALDFTSGIARLTFIASSDCQSNTDGVKFVCGEVPPATGKVVDKSPVWEITQDGTDKSIDWVDYAPNPRFAIYENGPQINHLVLDKATGLVWTRFAQSGLINHEGCSEVIYWEAAVDCPALSITSYNGGGWRLPSVEELSTLWQMKDAVFEGGLALPENHPFIVPECDWDADPSCETPLYWTSTSSTINPAKAFVILFQCDSCYFSGDLVHHLNLADKSEAHWWWAVRGGK